MSNSMLWALAAMFGSSAVISVILYAGYKRLNRDFEKTAREAFGGISDIFA